MREVRYIRVLKSWRWGDMRRDEHGYDEIVGMKWLRGRL
jgi:hypothetical protein